MPYEMPQLIIARYVHDEPFAYMCSVCAQSFLRPEDRNLEEGAIEIRQAFEVHIQEEHPEAMAS
jgi:hypothetical protein